LRVGIRPMNEEWMRGPLEEFVLGAPGVEEKRAITALLPEITDSAERWVREQQSTEVNESRPKSTKVD